MSKLANDIFDILKLCWSFSVAEKQYLKWVIITEKCPVFKMNTGIFLAFENDLYRGSSPF